MSNMEVEIENLKKALDWGCIVIIGGYRIIDIEIEKGTKGGTIIILKTTSGKVIKTYLSRLLNYRVEVICNEK